MGIMLLKLKYDITIPENTIISIIRKTQKWNLNINYNTALFIYYVIKNEPIPESLISYWEYMNYFDLYSASSEYKLKQCSLKLTVM